MGPVKVLVSGNAVVTGGALEFPEKQAISTAVEHGAGKECFKAALKFIAIGQTAFIGFEAPYLS